MEKVAKKKDIDLAVSEERVSYPEAVYSSGDRWLHTQNILVKWGFTHYENGFGARKELKKGY